MIYKLTVTERTRAGSNAAVALRKQDLVPGIVYGANLEKPLMISVTAPDLLKVWQDAGETSVVTLAGISKNLSVLITEVSVDPVYGKPIHVDFYSVRTDQAVEVDVPLVFVGVAPAEKELGGTLIKVLHALTIEALPQDLPHEIEVDISSLVTFDDQILVRDIVLPKGVTAKLEPEEVVALAQPAREEEEAVAEPVDLASVEVAKKGKEEEPTA
jgi:large subunit ribosomal protein L25